MASLLALHLLIIISIISFSKASKFPSLLSVTCTPTFEERPLFMNNKSIKILLNNLTSHVTKTRFITSTFSLGLNHYNGVMQCLPTLTPKLCIFCAQRAKQTVLTLCPNASSATAWFDGCYLQYNNDYSNQADLEVTNCSCSNQLDLIHFESDLETLLLRLRADIFSLHKFSRTGYIRYDNVSNVYAFVGCVQSLSKDCDVCVAKAIGKLYEHCGGKEGGIVAAKHCIVRYESYQFFSYFDNHGGSSGVNGGVQVVTVRDWKKEKSGGGGILDGLKVKVGLFWGIGVVCFMVIVCCAWLLKISIINQAKVAAFT